MSYKNQLNYFYDQEADILYLSKGKPSRKDISDELGDGIVARYDTKTKEIKGLTILNFAARTKKTSKTIRLPLEIAFTQQ